MMIPDPPRQLGLRALWLALGERPQSLLIGLMFTLMSVVQVAVYTVVILPHFPDQDVEKIRREGKDVEGEVTRIEEVPNFELNGIHPKRICFQYKANGVQRYECIETLSVAEIAKWQPGQAVDVRYLGERAVIVGLEPVAFPFPVSFMYGAFGMFALLGVPFLVYSVRGSLRKYRVLRHGVVRPAKLHSFDSQTTFLTWHRSSRFKATYAY